MSTLFETSTWSSSSYLQAKSTALIMSKSNEVYQLAESYFPWSFWDNFSPSRNKLRKDFSQFFASKILFFRFLFKSDVVSRSRTDKVLKKLGNFRGSYEWEKHVRSYFPETAFPEIIVSILDANPEPENWVETLHKLLQIGIHHVNEERTFFLLLYCDGMSVEEIEEVMEMPDGFIYRFLGGKIAE